MSGERDKALDEALTENRESFERDGDTIAIWKSIEIISIHNRKKERYCSQAYPLPDWVLAYLARCADKITRLQLGIDPSDDRDILEMDVQNIGQLCKVARSDGLGKDRFRDERANHIGKAFGLVGNGWNAFQRHGSLQQENLVLKIHDNPQLDDHPELQKHVRRSLRHIQQNQENITPETFKNRLSVARKRRRKGHET